MLKDGLIDVNGFYAVKIFAPPQTSHHFVMRLDAALRVGLRLFRWTRNYKILTAFAGGKPPSSGLASLGERRRCAATPFLDCTKSALPLLFVLLPQNWLTPSINGVAAQRGAGGFAPPTQTARLDSLKMTTRCCHFFLRRLPPRQSSLDAPHF
jgi:hypothetical protein